MAEFREGQTATNPKTGQQIVYRSGQWVSAGPANGGAMPRPKLSTREQMFLDEARTAARGSDEAALTAEQFVDINRNQNTGGWRAIPGATDLAGALDPEISRMNSLTARMAPQQRVPGSGTTSDRDLSLYLQAVPSAAKPGNVNSDIARQARADAERRSRYVQFLDRYVSQNGSLLGAEQAWRTEQAAAGKPRIASEAAMGTQQRMKRNGTLDLSRPRGDPHNPYIAKDDAILARLPKGSWAIGPDGQYGQVE